MTEKETRNPTAKAILVAILRETKAFEANLQDKPIAYRDGPYSARAEFSDYGAVRIRYCSWLGLPEHCGTTSKRGQRALRVLVEKGLVIRVVVHDNERPTHCMLTDSGRKLAEQLTVEVPEPAAR